MFAKKYASSQKGRDYIFDNTDAESSSGEPGEIDMACQNLRKFIKGK